jgi:hypothetical protein
MKRSEGRIYNGRNIDYSITRIINELMKTNIEEELFI